MPYNVLFFDLDDTLYPPESGLWPAIQSRMNLFMQERLHLPPAEVTNLRRNYFEIYGTTLRGLQLHYQVDANDFLTYVHDLPIQEYLHPAPQLRNLLLTLSLPRWIFTNSSADHARRVLDVLGISDCFCGIIDIFALEFTGKPDPEAYRRALRLVGESDPRRAVFFDDLPRNLAAAQRVGFTTVLVGFDGRSGSEASFSLPDLLALPEIMPELLQSKLK